MKDILLSILGLIILATILVFLLDFGIDNPINTDNYQPDYFETFGR